MKKNTAAQHTSYCPHVKWGALLGSLFFTLISIFLFVFNLTKTPLGYEFIDIMIAYGPISGAFFLIPAYCLLFEEFLPSFFKHKAYKEKKKTLYYEFLNENPQYKI